MGLVFWVALYLVASMAIGLVAALRVKSTADFAVAGRSMPLAVVVATSFATWFGSETVLGIPARFVHGGLEATVEDPWGCAFCLVLVGAFLARPLYRMNLLTIGDYYRQRYGKSVEMTCSIVSILSYLGWVAAQVTALALVFGELSQGAIGPVAGMVLGIGVVLFYTALGGMVSVALTDFLQVILIVAGLSAIAYLAADLAGGLQPVLEVARGRDMFRVFPEPTFHAWAFYIGAAITLMLGSMPQQDVFQRVMSANSEDNAARGPIIGGVAYLLFAFVPMFIVTASLIVMPDEADRLLDDDSQRQRLLPLFVMTHAPFWMQVLFFGALLSAIMSTASATLLAPSTLVVQNVLKDFLPTLSDRGELRLMRFALFGFAAGVLGYAIAMQGTTIYELVASSYEAPVVAAVVPLVAGIYWPRASKLGAQCSIVLGLAVWLAFHATWLGLAFPPQLAGLAAAIIGMVTGSLASATPREAPAVEPSA
ncbi:MAG: sodium:solute symporter family protein [Lacipirellulaceae bacterium]